MCWDILKKKSEKGIFLLRKLFATFFFQLCFLIVLTMELHSFGPNWAVGSEAGWSSESTVEGNKFQLCLQLDARVRVS